MRMGMRMRMILRMMRCRRMMLRMMRMRMRRTRMRMMIFSQASQDVRVSCLTSMTCFRTLSQNQPPLAHRAALGAHRPCHHHQGIQGRHIDVGTARISSCPTPCTVARFRPNGIPLSGSLGSAIVFFFSPFPSALHGPIPVLLLNSPFLRARPQVHLNKCNFSCQARRLTPPPFSRI